MKNNIYVQDNFFKKDFLKKLQTEIINLEFKSRYNDISTLADKDSPSNNLYQRNYHHVSLSGSSPVVHEVVKNIKQYFNYSVKEMTSNYFLSFPDTPPIPHEDGSEYNCLIFIVGDKLINNGTGFYEKVDKKYQLHSHVGFKENRAIFFDSKIWHSPLQFAGNSTPRYVMANFIYDR